jgi:hypothetical protein
MPESPINVAELAELLSRLLEPPLLPDRTPQDNEGFLTARFVRYDRDPDEDDRILVLHPDGEWRNLTGDRACPSADNGLPYDIDTDQPIEGRRIDLPAGAVVRRLLQALALAGAFEIRGNYHERWVGWYASPDPYDCALEDGCYRFKSLADLRLQHIMGNLPQFAAHAEPSPPGVLRVYGGIALQLARDSGFQLKLRSKSGAIVDCPVEEAGFLLRRISSAGNEAEVRSWLPHGEMDIFLDLQQDRT